MDQQDNSLSVDQVLGLPTSPSGDSQAIAHPDMLAFANQQLSYGQSPDDAIANTYAKFPERQGVKFTLSPDKKSFIDEGISNKPQTVDEIMASKPMSVDEVLGQGDADFTGVVGSSEVVPESWSDKLGKFATEWAKNKQADTAQAIGNIQSYFHDWQQKHQSIDAGQITPRERAAAKLLGMNLSDYQLGQWGQIYKMSPDERDQLDQKFQESLGLHPQQTKERLEKTTGTDFSEFDPYGKLLNDSLVTHGISQIANPNLANSRRYHEVQDMVHAMDVVENPKNYSEQEVKANADYILAYKKMNEEGITGQLKQQWQDIKKNPIGQAKAITGGVASEPELMLAPEAKLGSFLAGGREAAAVGAQASASRLAQLAKGVAGAAKETPAVSEAAEAAANVYGRVASRAAATAKQAAAVRHIGNIVGQVSAGAAINTASSAIDQFANQGYVSPGTLPVAAGEGAAFGGLSHFLASDKLPLTEELKQRAQPSPTSGPSHEGVPDVNAGKKPGEPLSPDTPINKTGITPYYGGVDASGRIIHLSDSTPDTIRMKNMSGKDVDVPVKQTVAYHEAVEYPLMHMEGPIDDETLAKLQQRIGDKVLPAKTIAKLKAGESLPYTNPDHEDTDPGAHEIATWAENHMVRTLYHVDPEKVYQPALKPHIKQVAKDAANAEPGDIPKNLDTKPYDDVDQNEQLMGRGNRPNVDNVKPGVAEGTDNKQKGKIDKRLLATGVAAGGGAAIGATTSQNKEAGAIAGGLAGLTTSALFWGGDIGARGKYQREGGMFTGPVSRTWKGTDRDMAVKMEKLGKTPEEIHLATGMYKNAAGQWNKEISDKEMKLVPPDHPNWERAKKEAIPLSTVLDHSKLEEAYPTLLDHMKVKIEPQLKSIGGMDEKTGTLYLKEAPKEEKTNWTSVSPSKENTPRSVIAHEIQHMVQSIEGFPTGASMEKQLAIHKNVRDYLMKRNEDLYMQILKGEREGKSAAELDKLEEQYEKVQGKLTNRYSEHGVKMGAFSTYARTAGEVEARSTQERLDMDEQERANTFPKPDTPISDQIVRGVGGTPIPLSQRGSIDPELLKKLGRAAAVGTLGASIGLALDKKDSLQGALIGAGLGILAGPILTDFIFHPKKSSTAVVDNIKDTVKALEKENITDAISRWQGASNLHSVEVYRVKEAARRLAPRKESQIRITHWIEGDKSIKLTDREMQSAKLQQEFGKKIAELGLQHGVLKDSVENHISHIWKNDEKLKAYKEFFDHTILANMSPETAFAKARVFQSIRQGKAAGLTPITEEANELTAMNARSVLQAIRNKQLLESLKAAKDKSGNSFLVVPARKAPSNYVPVNHPQLRGILVHPTIAPELRSVFYTYDLGKIESALSTFNMAIKKSLVSFSLFHLTSLLDAYLGGMPTFTHPVKTLASAGKSIIGQSDWHKFLRGDAGPELTELGNRFLHSSANPQIPGTTGAGIDVNSNYYTGLQRLQEYADRAFPGLGKIPEVVGKIHHAFDHLIFENAMSGMKFSLWMHAVSEMNESWAKELRRNPDAKAPTQAEIDRTAGGFVNNLLGSQNWLMAADQATTSIGRAYLQFMASPSGKRIAPWIAFAPDWDTSTSLSFLKALPNLSNALSPKEYGNAVRGLSSAKNLKDLTRQYQVRSALIYFMIGNAINYAYSGHSIMDNKDKGTIDLGNGQRLQWNKHWLEPYQMMRHLGQTIINKMGTVPREILDQIFHREYINTEGISPPMKEGRLTHAVGQVMPIPFQGFSQQTPIQHFWNMAGRNVLGHPTSGPEAEEYRAEGRKKRSEAVKRAAATRAAKRRQKYFGD